MNLLFAVLGGALLYLGGETLVKFACRLGNHYGLSPLVIGLTIVAFGTSAPELATSIAAVTSDLPAISFGNVVGSNIANLGLILGLTAIVFPLKVMAKFLKRDGLFMLGTSALMVPFALDGSYSRLEGGVMVLLLIGYLSVLFRLKEAPAVEGEYAAEFSDRPNALWRCWVGVLVGIVLLVIGGHYMVMGGAGLARDLGVPERVIGLTLIAFGTSLPELATSVAAAVRREGDIVLGNVIGSNVFNVLAVLGLTSIVQPVVVPWAEMRIDLAVMLAISVLSLLLLRTRYLVSRTEGVILLASYVGYLAYLAMTGGA